MQFRRAETDDIPGIKDLIKGGFGRDDMERALKRRYGETSNLAQIIETSPFALVAIDSTNKIMAFISLGTSPPESLPAAKIIDPDGIAKPVQIKLSTSNWAPWITENYNLKNIQLSNTLFIQFFCCQPDEGPKILDRGFQTIFNMVPAIENIIYFLPDSLILFPPFSSARPKLNTNNQSEKNLLQNKVSTSFFIECPVDTGYEYPYSVQICSRHEFLPEFVVRKARIEDCDDLIPLLQKNYIITKDKDDNYMAQLLTSMDDNTISLVAEYFGFKIVPAVPTSKTASLQKKNVVSTMAPQQINDSDLLVEKDKPITYTDLELAIQNCFHIAIFCIEPEHAPSSIKFINYAFNLWKELDYCVLTSAAETPENELTRKLSSVKPRVYQQNRLYVANRYGFQDSILVRQAELNDINEMMSLSKNMHEMYEFKNCVREQFMGQRGSIPKMKSFVAIHNNQVVGTVCLELCSDGQADQLADQYDIEQFINLNWCKLQGTYSIVKFMIVNPLFECQMRYFCQEIMRLLDMKFLLFPRNSKCLHDEASKRLALKEFVPVKPRRTIEYPDNLRDGEEVAKIIPYNLQIITVALIYEPRLVVHTRILVYGSSDVAISFVENLVYTPHIQFTNLMIASRSNWNKHNQKDPIMMSIYYTESRLRQLALDYYVKVMHQHIFEINRNQKVVTTKENIKIEYDYLIIAPLLRYCLNSITNCSQLELKTGVFSLNRFETEAIKNYIQNMAKTTGNVLIYGRTLQAYRMVNYCLSNGIAGDRITLADPANDQTFFEDPKMFKILRNDILDNGVQFYQGTKLKDFQEYDGRITGVTMLDKTMRNLHITGLECFFYADRQYVDDETITCINDACLAFDGLLLIDQFFRTNDPFIFGAGPITKYKVSVKTDWKQEYCNPIEVGAVLYSILLNLFDPMATPNAVSSDEPLYNYRNAISISTELAGTLHYFKFDIPKLPNYLKDPETRDLVVCVDQDDYCSIRINPKGYIESFSYLGPRTIPFSNLQCLYGKHEKYFNRLVARYDEGVIKDFIAFLSENWSLALFHDKFPKFLLKLENMAKEAEGIKDIYRSVASLEKITNQVSDEIYDKFDKCEKKPQLDALVFEYLSQTKIFKNYP